MANRLAITLDDDQRQHLEALAAERHETPAAIAAHALAEYLAEDSAFRRAVEEGLLAGRAGDVEDFRPFAEELRRKMAIRAVESDR